MTTDAGARFTRLWNAALAEARPDPHGAAGELVRALADLLDVEQVEYGRIGEAALFLLNLSSLGFRGMDLNVAMVTRPPRDEAESREHARLIEEYKDAVKSIGFCFHLVLDQTPPGRNPFVASSTEIVTLAGDDLDRMFRSQVPSAVLFEVLRRQVQLHLLCPFNTTREARGAMFRGRRNELERLTGEADTHFLVTGARMIGKTSLLRRAYNILYIQRDMRERLAYFDCSVWGGVKDCVLRLVNRIEPSEERRLEQNLNLRKAAYILKRRSYDGRRPLTLFFDECDSLVDAEAQSGWPFLGFLHEAAANRWARLAFAGFRSAQTLQHDGDSPFHNRLECLTLGPLSPAEAEGLLIEPMKAAGVGIDQSDLIAKRVLADSAGQPFLVQFFGERLFRMSAERTPQRIAPEDVEAIADGPELSRFLKTHFLWNTTLRGQPVTSERVFALLLAHLGDGDGWSQQQFEMASGEHGHPVGMDHAYEALTNLCDARVLGPVGRRYAFAFPRLRSILREDHPDLDAAIAALRA